MAAASIAGRSRHQSGTQAAHPDPLCAVDSTLGFFTQATSLCSLACDGPRSHGLRGQNASVAAPASLTRLYDHGALSDAYGQHGMNSACPKNRNLLLKSLPKFFQGLDWGPLYPPMLAHGDSGRRRGSLRSVLPLPAARGSTRDCDEAHLRDDNKSNTRGDRRQRRRGVSRSPCVYSVNTHRLTACKESHHKSCVPE